MSTVVERHSKWMATVWFSFLLFVDYPNQQSPFEHESLFASDADELTDMEKRTAMKDYRNLKKAEEDHAAQQIRLQKQQQLAAAQNRLCFEQLLIKLIVSVTPTSLFYYNTVDKMPARPMYQTPSPQAAYIPMGYQSSPLVQAQMSPTVNPYLQQQARMREYVAQTLQRMAASSSAGIGVPPSMQRQ